MGNTLGMTRSASEDHLTLIDFTDEYVVEVEGPDASSVSSSPTGRSLRALVTKKTLSLNLMLPW